jgi:hypothetical protein
MHDVSNPATQSTHAIRLARSVIATLQLPPSGGVNAVQSVGKPMAAGIRSSSWPQALSGPPHALQIVVTCLVCALAMAPRYLPSPAAGGVQSPLCLPFSRPSQHFWRALLRAATKAAVDLPIAAWQALTAPLLGRARSSETRSIAWSTAAPVTQAMQVAMSPQWSMVLVHAPCSMFGQVAG